MVHWQFPNSTVAEVKNRLGGSEFVGWQAYNQIAPLNLAQRMEQMIAQLTAMTANVHKGKGGKTRKAKDFLPDYAPPREQTGEEMEAALDRFFKRI